MLGWMYNLDTLQQELANGIGFDRLLVNNELIGFASYGPVNGEMKLHKLYIHPQWQRRGLGTKLLEHVEQRARARGFSKLVLGVNKANQQAIAAYHRNGFVIRESVVNEIGNGFVMNDYVMEKELH